MDAVYPKAGSIQIPIDLNESIGFKIRDKYARSECAQRGSPVGVSYTKLTWHEWHGQICRLDKRLMGLPRISVVFRWTTQSVLMHFILLE